MYTNVNTFVDIHQITLDGDRCSLGPMTSSFGSFETQRGKSVFAYSSGWIKGMVQCVSLGKRWGSCQENLTRSPPAEITARRSVVCRLGGGMVRFAGCHACLSGVWCGVRVTLSQFKIFL